MIEMFGWWLAIEVVGLLSLPLAATLLRHLPDHGWAFGKPLGLLVCGWLVWFPLTVISALPFTALWIVGTLVVFAAINLALLRAGDVRAALRRVLVEGRVYVMLCEALFAGAFAVMGWVRSFTPGVVDTEKFMDVAFLAAIWRAPHLPAPDPWLSGYTINYYYFGHFLLATMAKVLGTQPATAFNIGVALIFALAAVSVFGVAASITATLRALPLTRLWRAGAAGLASALAVLVLGNLNAVQSWWQVAGTFSQGAAPALANPLAWWLHPNLWAQQDWWVTWWAPSRVIPNTITEFPAFSFLLADLHAHVLALPFVTVAIGMAFNLLLATGNGLRVFGRGIPGAVALVTAGIVLGSLYAINGWDLPTYLGLALLALVIQQWLAHERRISSLLLLDFLIVSAVLVALSLALYMPFYRGFSSPSEGVGLVPPSVHTPISDLFAIFGVPIFLVLSLLTWHLACWAARAGGSVVHGAGVVVGVVALLLLTLLTPGYGGWVMVWGGLVIGGCAALALRRLQFAPAWRSAPGPHAPDLARSWLYCVIGTAAALVVTCELVYLRDVFAGGPDFRMNTVFKLYYQAWLLLGIASGPVALWLLRAAGVSACRLAGDGRAVRMRRPRAAKSGTPAPLHLALAVQGGMPTNSSGCQPRPWPVSFAQTPADHDAPPPAGWQPAQALDAGDQPSPRRVPRSGGLWLLRPVSVGGIVIWTGALALLSAGSLVYPVLATVSRTDGFSLPRTLDGTAYMATDPANQGDGPAIAWLNTHIQGEQVIVEAAQYTEYTHLGRISAFTGLPTLLGWGGHEVQWRYNWFASPAHASIIQQRLDAVKTIYSSTDARTVQSLLRQYHVRLIYVGAAERQVYGAVDLSRFAAFLRPVYRQGGVVIYAVRQ